MSPNEQKITSGRPAMATALSRISIGVTHTGQPGPWISVISRGSISSSAKRTIECVCPPQISMMFHGRVVAAPMAAARRRTASALRYSSRNRKGVRDLRSEIEIGDRRTPADCVGGVRDVSIAYGSGKLSASSLSRSNVSCASASSMRLMAKPT